VLCLASSGCAHNHKPKAIRPVAATVTTAATR
jgi:hypothetical protein